MPAGNIAFPLRNVDYLAGNDVHAAGTLVCTAANVAYPLRKLVLPAGTVVSVAGSLVFPAADAVYKERNGKERADELKCTVRKAKHC